MAANTMRIAFVQVRAGQRRGVPSLGEDDHPVAHLRELTELRRHPQHRHLVQRGGRLHEPVDVLAGTHVDALGGFVQQQQPGPGDQPLGQQRLLLVAA
jgi:hypothetical protein